MADNDITEVLSVFSVTVWEDGAMATESIGVRSWPLWVRGPAEIDGDEIVLDAARAKPYSAFESEHYATLLPDLAALRNFELQDPVAFARRHGLLWHGPEQVRAGECRESLAWWGAVGEYLTIAISLYAALKNGLDEDTAEPVRDHMWAYRDAGFFVGAIPDDKNECLEYASIQLAEMIARGLEGCAVTFVAASGLVRGDGKDRKKLGPAGDFRYVYQPPDLVGAAYKYLASLIVSKAEFRECKGCGRWFQPSHGRQTHHTKDCGNSKRQRELRQRRKEGHPA
jgi:hypothetical protein